MVAYLWFTNICGLFCPETYGLFVLTFFLLVMNYCASYESVYGTHQIQRLEIQLLLVLCGAFGGSGIIICFEGKECFIHTLKGILLSSLFSMA